MLSRVADSLFWLGRYAERIEANTHIITRQLERIIEHSLNDETMEKECEALIKICGYYDDFHLRYKDYNFNDVIEYLLFDKENYNSIVALAESARFNLKNTRDLVPQELWEVWQDLYDLIQTFSNSPRSMMEVTAFLKQIRISSFTATGIIDSLMSRDESFMFVKIGKWLERAEKTSLILKTLLLLKVENEYSFAANYVLYLTNTYEDFNNRHISHEELDVLQYIVGDEKCTRAIHYSVKKIHRTIVDLQNGQYETYTDLLFKELYDLKMILRKDCHKLTLEERVEWVKSIHAHCMHFGPIFSRTYFLTPPILVN